MAKHDRENSLCLHTWGFIRTLRSFWMKCIFTLFFKADKILRAWCYLKHDLPVRTHFICLLDTGFVGNWYVSGMGLMLPFTSDFLWSYSAFKVNYQVLHLSLPLKELVTLHDNFQTPGLIQFSIQVRSIWTIMIQHWVKCS